MSRMMAAAALVGLLVFAQGASAQTDPNVGTWVLNIAKSNYNGGIVPKSSTVVVESAGQGIKVTGTTLLPDGTTRTVNYTVNYDGKEAAVTGTADYNMVSMTRTGNTTKAVRRRGGKRAQTVTIVVSADGKTRTTSVTGTDATGKKVNLVQVYDRK